MGQICLLTPCCRSDRFAALNSQPGQNGGDNTLRRYSQKTTRECCRTDRYGTLVEVGFDDLQSESLTSVYYRWRTGNRGSYSYSSLPRWGTRILRGLGESQRASAGAITASRRQQYIRLRSLPSSRCPRIRRPARPVRPCIRHPQTGGLCNLLRSRW